MIIRAMQPTDVDAVRELDSQAFTPYVRKTGRGDSVPLRNRDYVLASLAINLLGCLVAESDGITGYVFSRRWGKVGWIGTFGVHPDKQGQGIGQKLLKASADNLKNQGCEIIGLETMVDSPYNLGLYAKYGFRPNFTTFRLTKKVESVNARPSFVSINDIEPEKGLEAVSEISNAALHGLDYACEAQNALDYGWGETILIGWPESWAVAIIMPAGSYAVVRALVIHPRAKDRISEAVQSINAWACDHNLVDMLLQINTVDWSTLQLLFADRLRVTQIMQRMLLKGSYQKPDGVDMSSWVM